MKRFVFALAALLAVVSVSEATHGVAAFRFRQRVVVAQPVVVQQVVAQPVVAQACHVQAIQAVQQYAAPVLAVNAFHAPIAAVNVARVRVGGGVAVNVGRVVRVRVR